MEELCDNIRLTRIEFAGKESRSGEVMGQEVGECAIKRRAIVIAACEGEVGLKIAHVGVDIAQDGIGRITDDDWDWHEGRTQIGLDEMHAGCQIEGLPIDAGHNEGIW